MNFLYTHGLSRLFFLYTNLLPMGFTPLGASTRDHAEFELIDSISWSILSHPQGQAMIFFSPLQVCGAKSYLASLPRIPIRIVKAQRQTIQRNLPCLLILLKRLITKSTVLNTYKIETKEGGFTMASPQYLSPPFLSH